MNSEIWDNSVLEKEKKADAMAEAKGMLRMLPVKSKLGKAALLALMTPALSKGELISQQKKKLIRHLIPQLAAYDYMKRWQYAVGKRKTISGVESQLRREKAIGEMYHNLKEPVLTAATSALAGTAAGTALSDIVTSMNEDEKE